MNRTLGGRRELDYTVRGERRSFAGAKLLIRGAFGGNEDQSVLGRGRVLQGGDRCDVEPQSILL